MANRTAKSASTVGGTAKGPLPWVVYTRVSTEEQVVEGVSLAAQEENCRAVLTGYQLPYLMTISDPGLSGKDLKRPGIQKVLELVRTGKIG